MEIKLL